IADPATDAARRRLHAVRGSTDGFALAQADLELRGPGELLGVRQAGLPDFSPLAREAPGHVAEAADRAVRNLLSSGATGAGGLSESLRRRLEKRFGMAARADEGPGVGPCGSSAAAGGACAWPRCPAGPPGRRPIG